MNDVKKLADWCYEQRDAAYAEGDVTKAGDYNTLGNMWLERETKKEEANAVKSGVCSEL